MSGEEPRKIKVTDRRAFTADGEPRVPASDGDAGSDDARQTDAGSERADAARSRIQEPLVSAHDGAAVSNPPEPTFAELVRLVADPVVLFLGDARLPGGESAEDPGMARYYIDLLDLLKDKTEGNLTDAESEMLDGLLYQLRLRYVQKRR